jgi:hypothetical protein
MIVLNRVRAFLPELLAANEDVQQRARENPSAVDIESFDGTEEAYIQLVRRILIIFVLAYPCIRTSAWVSSSASMRNPLLPEMTTTKKKRNLRASLRRIRAPIKAMFQTTILVKTKAQSQT